MALPVENQVNSFDLLGRTTAGGLTFVWYCTVPVLVLVPVIAPSSNEGCDGETSFMRKLANQTGYELSDGDGSRRRVFCGGARRAVMLRFSSCVTYN